VAVPPHHCRFLARTGSDDTHQCRFHYTTGSDDPHHCQFVVRISSDDALLYIEWACVGEIFCTLSNCRACRYIPPLRRMSLPSRPPIPQCRRLCFTVRPPEQGSHPMLSPTTTPPEHLCRPRPILPRHRCSTDDACALFFIDAAEAPQERAKSC
jgi:hypothetical protein